ncbi:MAG: hypothetical protein IV100_16845 [Myxococcales bacterium]|nr:hypothetical protein [Myxococcales bacterium]
MHHRLLVHPVSKGPRALPVLLLALFVLPGCIGWSPPIRGALDGMPERGNAGRASAAIIGAAGNAFGAEAELGVHVDETTRLRVGGGWYTGAAMGSFGAQFLLVDRPAVRFGLGVDLGFAFGGEEVDQTANEDDNNPANEGLAIGGAMNAVVGLPFHRYGQLTIPLRLQVTDVPSNTMVPTTLYVQGGLGWHADWTSWFFTRLDANVTWLQTVEAIGEQSTESLVGLTGMVVLGFRFGPDATDAPAAP